MGKEIDLLKKLQNLKEDNNKTTNFIKEGWLTGFDNDFFKKPITYKKTKDEEYESSIIECIEQCTSPKISEGSKPFSDKNLKLIFNAFSLFKPEETRVLIIGQDPYPDDDVDRVKYYGRRAHGLAFSFANTKGIIEPPDDSLFCNKKNLEQTYR